MQRENYIITSNRDHNVTKHKWNSAIRETEALIKEIAIQENTVYELVESHSHKEGFGFVKGHRTWKGKNGNVVTFSVVKEIP